MGHSSLKDDPAGFVLQTRSGTCDHCAVGLTHSQHCEVGNRALRGLQSRTSPQRQWAPELCNRSGSDAPVVGFAAAVDPSGQWDRMIAILL